MPWWRNPPRPPGSDVRKAPDQADALAARLESAVQQAFPDLWAALTDAGRAQFVGTLLRARRPGERERVVEGWYRTMTLLSNPAFQRRRRELDRGEIVKADPSGAGRPRRPSPGPGQGTT